MASMKTQMGTEPLKTAIDMVFSYPGCSREEYIARVTASLGASGLDFDAEIVSQKVDEALSTF